MKSTRSDFKSLEKFRNTIYYCIECRCGFCREGCPAFTAIRKETAHARGFSAIMMALLEGDINLSQQLSENLMLCVACNWCTERCPLNKVDEFAQIKKQRIDIPKMLEGFREELINQSLVPLKVAEFFESVSKYGNPFKLPQEKRDKWIEGTQIKKYESGDEFLYYVGCVGSYDTRGKEIAKTLGQILLKSEISFGVLGNDENCCGNEIKILGEKGLFESLVNENIKKLKELNVKKIVTLCPHAYNVMKNYYPLYGGDFEVMHYTQLLNELIKSGKIDFFKSYKARITYHDPCFLGRYNKEYDAPREVIQAIPGVEFIEMERIKENSFCCGGGSANFYTDLLNGKESSPNRVRVREAYNSGAEILAVACPICMTMLEDGLKEEGLEEKLTIKDISEIVKEACGLG